MNHKLRIALFFSSNPTNTGGVQEHILYLSEELRKRGHSVTIFGPEGKCSHFDNYRKVGYTIQIPLPNGNWASIQMGNAFSSDITSAINPREFDILHIHEPYIPFLAWETIDKVNLPKVSTFHSAWDDNSSVSAISSLMPLFKKSFSSKTEAAIFVSSITKKRWLDLCSRRVMKFVIPNAVDHDNFFPLKKTNKRVKLLFLGRMVQRKGIHYLLQAVRNALKEFPDIELDIVGDGAERESTLAFIKRNRLEKSIHYHGEIFGRKRVKYFQHADIFCAPYFDEAYPLTIIEAMSCGCTIVGFENESVKESLRRYPDRSLLVAPRDVPALTRALKKAISNAKLRQSIRRWCIREGTKYSWEKVAEQTETVYRKVLAKDYA